VITLELELLVVESPTALMAIHLFQLLLPVHPPDVFRGMLDEVSVLAIEPLENRLLQLSVQPLQLDGLASVLLYAH
jgi:hypothetical protein